ncbi:uncharacterized protein BDR25DRAFT_325135 [Lindgomyces ingoldianus]|uniref:Uncharacterized protein n=1 Tax=Lindgomyces ingoldianus TaxID=673940 RepID=A0ACB6QWK5_9PLEO|nr:uncharacterized protein BDR25DRAFT_325135 [Lindgomyces ingoldianus]KAF2471388.1 hypothetical protein BDR25DRAFT_325135 [Lindgomyces ingoldianus]
MLSLPLITPRPDASLWPSHRLSNTSFDAPSADSQNPSSSNGHRRPNSRHGHHSSSSRSALAALAADENVIYQRKQNVRRFGAGWIRPPGVAKTYQATMDEAAEREEQEILARREQVLLDLAAAQTETANQQQAAEGADEEMAEPERDLDDEVPEAEADESDVSVTEDDVSGVDEGDNGHQGQAADITFNEDSFIEGSMVAGEVERMLEMEEAEMTGVLQEERDLDDDIPEAGSYEHTETDLEDSSSEEDASRGPAPSTGRRSSGRQSSGRSSFGIRGGRRNRSSIEIEGSSSIIDGSSFLRSSPAAARGSLRSQFMRSRGRAE